MNLEFLSRHFACKKIEICLPKTQYRIRCSSAAEAPLLTEVAVPEELCLNVYFLVYVHLQSTFVSLQRSNLCPFSVHLLWHCPQLICDIRNLVKWEGSSGDSEKRNLIYFDENVFVNIQTVSTCSSDWDHTIFLLLNSPAKRGKRIEGVISNLFSFLLVRE